ncbi:hypothetical protein HDU93_007860 [Gonapodya sp. JEL0774]|nr:hypothetical protein HDU93_007860 [Gonapodya sp. JEL0774]
MSVSRSKIVVRSYGGGVPDPSFRFQVRGPKGLQASNVTGVGGIAVRGDPKVAFRGSMPISRPPYFYPPGQAAYVINSPGMGFVYAGSPPTTFISSQALISPASSPSFPGSPPMLSSASPMLPPQAMMGGPSSPTSSYSGIPMYALPRGGFAQFTLPGPVRAESPAGPQSPYLTGAELSQYHLLQMQPRMQPLSPPPTQTLMQASPPPLQGLQQAPYGMSGGSNPRPLRYSRGSHSIPGGGGMYEAQSPPPLAGPVYGYPPPAPASRGASGGGGLPPLGPNASAEEHSGRSEIDLRFEQLTISKSDGETDNSTARRDEVETVKE